MDRRISKGGVSVGVHQPAHVILVGMGDEDVRDVFWRNLDEGQAILEHALALGAVAGVDQRQVTLSADKQDVDVEVDLVGRLPCAAEQFGDLHGARVCAEH